MTTFVILTIIVLVIVTFTRLKKAKHSNNKAHEEVTNIQEMISEFQENDCLGKAGEAGTKAKQALKEKDFNEAWRLFNEQKSHYMEHANKCGFSAQDALSLDSTVHENLANILRIEGKHHDAFFNILYWVIASHHRPIKKHKQKLIAYFNRCKFKNTTIDDVNNYIEKHGNTLVNVLEIKEQVAKWRATE
ncbi:MAG: hypothetical protein JEZ03_18560 [Bacteroidales bacterium]|nr:hypothetical protein [Bacteroidales bacterium]